MSIKDQKFDLKTDHNKIIKNHNKDHNNSSKSHSNLKDSHDSNNIQVNKNKHHNQNIDYHSNYDKDQPKDKRGLLSMKFGSRPTPAYAPLFKVNSLQQLNTPNNNINITSSKSFANLSALTIRSLESPIHFDKDNSSNCSETEENNNSICKECGQTIASEPNKLFSPMASSPFVSLKPYQPEVRKPWRKILYERQPYDDNYVPDSFMSSAIMNAKVSYYTYWNTFNATLNITHQLAAAAIFYVVYTLVVIGEVSSSSLMLIDVLAFIIGFTMYSLMVYVTTTDKSEDEVEKPEKEIEIIQPADDNCYVPACTPYVLNANPDKLTKLYSRFRGLPRFFIFIGVIHIFSPVLQTLTLAFSSDTISALSFLFLAIHLFLFDYDAVSSNHPDFSGTISLNAALLTSVLLASRLPSSVHVFAFICFAFEIFAGVPIFLVALRRFIGQGRLRIALSFLFNGCATLSLCVISNALSFAFFILIGFVTFVCPAIIIFNQKYKNHIQGPWDYDDSKELDEL